MTINNKEKTISNNIKTISGFMMGNKNDFPTIWNKSDILCDDNNYINLKNRTSIINSESTNTLITKLSDDIYESKKTNIKRIY